MSATQVFVGLWAIASIVVCVLAVWRVATSSKISYRPLWIIGCLFGFVGFATTLSTPGDLYIDVGIQVPVIILWTANGSMSLKAMFPLVAAVALAVIDARSTPSPNESESTDA